MIGNEELVMEGYVYILEVKDIVLPVCKIGMTERNPWRRCAEINSGSTGDFIWEVAHYVFVDRCRELESLVHSKLAPLRQKRREFFGITADAAYTALLSILESQDAIHQLEPPEVQPSESKTQGKARRAPATRSFRKIDTEYAAVLQLFSSELKIKGKPFGQLNTRRFGISDGNRGVQWNLAVNSETNEIRIGINLEGSANTGGWLIADFIKSNRAFAPCGSSWRIRTMSSWPSLETPGRDRPASQYGRSISVDRFFLFRPLPKTPGRRFSQRLFRALTKIAIIEGGTETSQ
jgi:hypothetical protein